MYLLIVLGLEMGFGLGLVACNCAWVTIITIEIHVTCNTLFYSPVVHVYTTVYTYYRDIIYY